MGQEEKTNKESGIQFSIDEQTCVQCGACAKDCPFGIIDAEPGSYPVMVNEDSCIRCLHCFAVCPTASLSILGEDPLEATKLSGNLPEKDHMVALIKGRRSVRHFKDENLAQELIQEMLDTTWHAPTGYNAQQNLLTVVDDKKTVLAIQEDVYSRLRESINQNSLAEHPAGEYLGMAVKMFDEQGVDIIFRGAPHILLVSSPKDGPSPVQDTHIALTTFDLLAPVMGVGTLWNGMLQWVLGLYPELQEKLGIPENHAIGYSMLFGKPAVKYHRTAERRNTGANIVKGW